MLLWATNKFGFVFISLKKLITYLSFSTNCQGVCLRHNLVQTTATSPKTIASPTHGNVQRFIGFTFVFLFRSCKPGYHSHQLSGRDLRTVFGNTAWKVNCVINFIYFSLLKIALCTNIISGPN